MVLLLTQRIPCDVLCSMRLARVRGERTYDATQRCPVRGSLTEVCCPVLLSEMPKKTKDQFLPGPLPGEEDVEVRAHQRRRKKAKNGQRKFGGIKYSTPADESRAQTKQPTMRRICRAEATRATLKVATRRFPSSTTPESTGKAGFPHDLEKGALQRRATHISKRRRKALDGELAKANSSDFHAKIVD